MRLIDADALHLWPDMDGHAIKEIEHAPTLQPVRHGKWIRRIEYHHGSDTYYTILKCSQCGFKVQPTVPIYKYCTYCGAMMDEKVSECD